MTVTLGSRTERFQVGKALRRKTPREAHADLKGSMSRNAVAILAESDPDRVPELVPERYARMTVNPFAFLRGAAAVMATDLAAQPTAGIPVQAGGDSHLMNFGAFVTPDEVQCASSTTTSTGLRRCTAEVSRDRAAKTARRTCSG